MEKVYKSVLGHQLLLPLKISTYLHIENKKLKKIAFYEKPIFLHVKITPQK